MQLKGAPNLRNLSHFTSLSDPGFHLDFTACFKALFWMPVKRIILLLAGLFLKSPGLFAQVETAPAMALGGCISPLVGMDAAGLNPAASPWKDHAGISLGHHHLNSVKELDAHTINISFSKHKKAIGLGLYRQGDERLRFTSASLWTSTFLSRVFSMGIRLRLETMNFGGAYGTSARIEGDVGFRAKLREELTLDGLITNLHQSMVVRKFLERSRTTARAGLAHRPSPSLILSLEYELDSYLGNDFMTGLSFRASPALMLSFGYSARFHRVSTGLSMAWRQFQSHLALKYRSDLYCEYMLTLIIKLSHED